MAGKTTDCAQLRESIVEAAVDGISGGRHIDFEAHISDCAICRAEFHRMQTLLQTIDNDVRVTVADQPSTQWIAAVRQQLDAQQVPELAWWPRNAWIAAVGICAVLAISLLVVRTSQRFHRQIEPYAADSGGSASAPSQAAVPYARRVANEGNDSAHLRRPKETYVRHSVSYVSHRSVSEPQVIVEPNQMQAILHFIEAGRNGQIGGAKLIDPENNVAQPLEIKPLGPIAPLKIEALDDDAGSSGSENVNEGFVNAGSN